MLRLIISDAFHALCELSHFICLEKWYLTTVYRDRFQARTPTCTHNIENNFLGLYSTDFYEFLMFWKLLIRTFMPLDNIITWQCDNSRLPWDNSRLFHDNNRLSPWPDIPGWSSPSSFLVFESYQIWTVYDCVWNTQIWGNNVMMSHLNMCFRHFPPPLFWIDIFIETVSLPPNWSCNTEHYIKWHRPKSNVY